MPLFMLWKLRHICMCGRSVEGPGDQARLPNNVSSHEFHSPAPYFNSHLFQPHKRVEFHSYFPTYMMSSCNRNLNIWNVFQCPLFVRDVFESRLFSTHTMYPWQFWIEVIRTHPYFSWSVWSKWGVRSLPVKYRLRGTFYCPKNGKKVPIKGTRLFTGVRLFIFK